MKTTEATVVVFFAYIQCNVKSPYLLEITIAVTCEAFVP